MASFCTQCGAANTGDTRFCTKCGAPLGAMASAATPPAYTASAGYGQPIAATVQAAPTAGSSALKIILIIVGIFVGLGILSVCAVIFGIWRVSRGVHVSALGDGGSVSVSTPSGTMTAGSDAKVSASDLGVDIYPGATQQKGAVRVSTPGGTAVTAAFTTSDSLEKVVDFYKGKLGAGGSVFQSDKSAVLTETNTNKKNSVMVTIEAESGGTTKFSILHSTAGS